MKKSKYFSISFPDHHFCDGGVGMSILLIL